MAGMNKGWILALISWFPIPNPIQFNLIKLISIIKDSIKVTSVKHNIA